MASAFDAFLKQAWADHAEHSEAVAARLRSDRPAPETAAQLAAFVRLVVHLCGEHLGAFDDGRERLQALTTHPLADDDVRSALRVGIASLTLAEFGQADLTAFTPDEQVRSLAAAAAIGVGRHNPARALALLADARRRVAALPSVGPATHRPLAVACNNMAWELIERGSARSTDETEAMLDIAAASQVHWAEAGTWLEVERSDYGLALAHLSAGRADDALPFAMRCLASCTQNAAPPFEHFFAHEALARVQHVGGNAVAAAHSVAAAQAAFDQLGADDREACRAALDTLHALAQ